MTNRESANPGDDEAEGAGSEGSLDRLHRKWQAGVGDMLGGGEERPADSDPSADEPVGATSSSRALLERLSAHRPRKSRYELVGEVARGGMGAILKVWDSALRRSLAMKVTLGKSSPEGDTPAVDEQVLGRFLEEAQVTGQLDHPGIVPVHELGLEADGQVFFTMRLVKGRDLKQIFDLVRDTEEGWTLTRALSVLLKVCEATAYAHSKGVLHRDLKPANVMVGQFGEVYVMDWGLAKVLDREDQHDLRPDTEQVTAALRTDGMDERDWDPETPLLTMDGTVLGTPAYMPPEQARGEIEALDRRSDVYALGAMLYHLLVGHAPYTVPGLEAGPYAVWRWVLESAPRAVHELAPDVPDELVAICEKAMAREPEERYEDMSALSRDLEAFLEGRVVAAYEAGAFAEAKKWVRRNKALATTLATALVVSLAAFVVIVTLRAEGEVLEAKGEALEVKRAAEARRALFAMDRTALARHLGERGLPSVGSYRMTRLGDGSIYRQAFVVDYAGPKRRFEIILETGRGDVTETEVVLAGYFGTFGLRVEGDTTITFEDEPLSQTAHIFVLELHKLDPVLPSGANIFAVLEYFAPESPLQWRRPNAFFHWADGTSFPHSDSYAMSAGSLASEVLSDSVDSELVREANTSEGCWSVLRFRLAD
jgi:serine/threonine protein kinase